MISLTPFFYLGKNRQALDFIPAKTTAIPLSCIFLMKLGLTIATLFRHVPPPRFDDVLFYAVSINIIPQQVKICSTTKRPFDN